MNTATKKQKRKKQLNSVCVQRYIRLVECELCQLNWNVCTYRIDGVDVADAVVGVGTLRLMDSHNSTNVCVIHLGMNYDWRPCIEFKMAGWI